MSKSGHALVFCRLFFIHNFPCQLGRGHSLFIYFYGLRLMKFLENLDLWLRQTKKTGSTNQLTKARRFNRGYVVNYNLTFVLTHIKMAGFFFVWNIWTLS